MEERQEPQTHLSPNVIRQGFSNQLKKLTFLNTYSPRIFMVYAHSLDGQEGTEKLTESLIAKQIQGYLNPTLQAPCPNKGGNLNLNLYSSLAPQGNGADTYNEYNAADVFYRQMCLLPKHEYSADYVILCGSHFLQEYLEIKEVKEYTNSLRKILTPELSKKKPSFKTLYTIAESALHTFQDRYGERNQRFHPIYTELAFLQLRSEEKYKDILPPHNLITLIIDRTSAISSSSSLLPDLQGNRIDIGTIASLEKDGKAFYLAIFQLLSCLFDKPELDICRKAIEDAHHVFKENINLAWTAEETAELAERQNNHEKKRISKQRTSAKHSFFAPSSLSEEELLTEVFPRTVCNTTTTVIDTAEITKVLRATYQQKYATLPRLFSEEEEAIADTFVNVAILKEEVVKAKERKLDTGQEKEGMNANDEEIRDNRLQSHERLYEVHETIAIGALFAPLSDTRSPRKLLLYGRAGIGKTVLCQYVVNQWAEKSDNMACFSQFQAVFWIPLRELLDRLEDRRKHSIRIQREMLVAEMVTACCLRDSDWQEKIKKQQLQLWLKSNAESTLFILDGYDEVAETAATPCMLSDCLDAVLNETQYKPYVMLTSRPVAIDRQYGSFDRRLECMGFIDKNIPVFVSRYISELQQSNDCLTFLKTHPSIWGIAHVPLHLELICWLWSRGELSLRSEQCLTMAALYTEIVEKIGSANYNKHALLKEACLYTCYDKESLTKNTIAHFANDFLSFLGFHAMQQEGVLLPGKKIKVWAQEFIRKSRALQADKTKFDTERLLMACLHLGLLKSTRQGGKDLFDHTYYFIHLSFQEFFAAKYYQQAFECSDVEVIEHFRTHKYTPSYQLTWWMSAGLLYQERSYSSLGNFFETLCTLPLDLIGIHHVNLLSHCLDECQADEKIYVVAQLTRHLAGLLKNLSKRDWLIGIWGKTLLHCSNLLRAKSFQDAGLYLFKKLKKFEYISSNTAALLSHLATQEAIACLTNQSISPNFRSQLAEACVERSDLTVKHVQSLIAYVANTELNDLAYEKLIQALFQSSGLTAGQEQSLFACLTDTMIQGYIRLDFAEALAQRSDLTAEQVESLFAYLTDTMIEGRVCLELAEALAQRSGLTAEQVQAFIACVTDRTVNGLACKGLAKALVQRSALTAEQVQSLFACVTDTTLDGQVRIGLAQALAQNSDLTTEQMQSLFACLTDTTFDEWCHVGLAKALAQHSNLTAKQVQFLIAYVTNTSIDDKDSSELAEALAQRSDLTAEQVESLFACLTDITFGRGCRKKIAETLAERSDLTAEQVESLFAYLTDRTCTPTFSYSLPQRSDLTAEQVQFVFACLTDDMTFDIWNRKALAEALAWRSDLTTEQVQSLFAYIADTRFDEWCRKGLANALAQRSNPTAKQVQFLIACVTDTSIDDGVRLELANALAERSDLTAEQVQALFACPTDTTIDKEVRNRLAQVLAEQQALFLYDEVNRIVLLRLGTRPMGIPLHLNHNLFLTLSHEVWRGNLHSIEIKEVCRQEDYSPLQATTCVLL